MYVDYIPDCWQKNAMDVWRGLVQVYIEGNDVLLTILSCDKIINVRRPLLNLWHTLDGIILLVVARLEDYLLITINSTFGCHWRY